MSRITLKDISREAGVSIATVSMALRGQGKLATKTIDKIKTTADRLGYMPDPILASLASRRFRSSEQSKGLPFAILEFPPHEGDKTRPTIQYRLGLMQEAKKLGYAPEVYSLEEMNRYQDFTRLLYHRGTVAVVICGQADLSLFNDPKRWASYAMVQCGRYRSTLPIHTVRPNVFQAIKLSFEKAFANGRKRIGFALGHHAEVLEDDLARLGAALALIQQNIPKKDQIPPFFGSLRDTEGTLEWVRKHQPDVVIGFSNSLWYALKDAGILCPRDMGFISLHGQTNESSSVDISCLDQSRDEVVRQSVLLIDQMVRHNERGIPKSPNNVLVSSSWIEGQTLKA